MEETTSKTQASLPEGWETVSTRFGPANVFLQLWLTIHKDYKHCIEEEWTESTWLWGRTRIDRDIQGDSTFRILGINPYNGLPYNAEDEFDVMIRPYSQSTSMLTSTNANVLVQRTEGDSLYFEIYTEPMAIGGIVNSMRAGGSLAITAAIEFMSVQVDFEQDFENAIYIRTETNHSIANHSIDRDWGFVTLGESGLLCVAKCERISVVEDHDMGKDLKSHREQVEQSLERRKIIR
jgi:hypothetical protein